MTPANTATITLTPTFTNTPVPGIEITWVASDAYSFDLKLGIARYLLANPPAGEDGDKIYAITNATADGDDWIISLVNLAGISPPYEGWTVLDNSVWIGSVLCSGSEVFWICSLYQPATGSEGGAVNLYMPWRAGTSAQYGIAGVHSGSTYLSGSVAVDLFGNDNVQNSMPAYAYPVANGVITAVCKDANNQGILVDSGAAGRFYYLHLNPYDSNLYEGRTVTVGTPISSLVKGSFSGGVCGWAQQENYQYHIHFVFLPIGGYLQMGGCTLNISTQKFLCGTTTYGVLSWLPNGGSSSPVIIPTPGPGTPSPTPAPGSPPTGPALGGEHIWDGLINGAINFTDWVTTSILSPHTDQGIAAHADEISTEILNTASLINSSQLVWITPALFFWGLIALMEIVRFVAVIYRWVLRMIPMAG